MSPMFIDEKWSQRRQLSVRQYNRCYWCHGQTSLPASGQTSQHSCTFTLDHIIPRGRGGLDHWENIVGACHRCNAVRDQLERILRGYGKQTLRLSRDLLFTLLPVDLFCWSIDMVQFNKLVEEICTI